MCGSDERRARFSWRRLAGLLAVLPLLVAAGFAAAVPAVPMQHAPAAAQHDGCPTAVPGEPAQAKPAGAPCDGGCIACSHCLAGAMPLVPLRLQAPEAWSAAEYVQRPGAFASPHQTAPPAEPPRA